MDVTPSTLHCPPALPSLTITGGHFGLSGASAVLTPLAGGSAPVPCPVVLHAPGAEDRVLVCQGARLPSRATPEWYELTVTPASRLQGSLSHAVLSIGRPVLSALVALGGACTQAHPRALDACPLTALRFGLVGSFQLSSKYTVAGVMVGPFRCPKVAVVNATYLECQGLVGSGQRRAVLVSVGTLQTQSADCVLSFVGRCSHKPGHWAGTPASGAEDRPSRWALREQKSIGGGGMRENWGLCLCLCLCGRGRGV